MDRNRLGRALCDRISRAAIGDQWRTRRSGLDTGYAIIDDLLPLDWAERIFAAFPTEQTHFDRRDSFRERKGTSVRFDSLPPLLKEATFAFQMPDVSALIAKELGIEGLAGDPSCYAGGLSMMGPGDFLNPHIDNSHNSTRTRYRRVNLLYYVTPNFPLSAGGNLELWDESLSHPVTIHSRFNRLVLMETNRHSWHSVSRIEPGAPARCCVSNYYFSQASPSGQEYYHVTSFTGRPKQLIRRLIAPIDNRARSFARTGLGLSRDSDLGYRPKEKV